MKMKIALFENNTYYGITPIGEWGEGSNDYTRLTEYVEIDFIDLDKGTVISEKVEKLHAAKAEMKEKFIKAMEDMETKIQELLAIGVDNDPI